MSFDRKPLLPFVPYFLTARETLKLDCEDTLGASKPDAEECFSQHTWLQERHAESPAPRRSPSAPTKTTKIQATPKSPGPSVLSHGNIESLAPVKPLRTLRRVAADPNLPITPSMMGTAGCTMAEARELFEQHGIDRPAG